MTPAPAKIPVDRAWLGAPAGTLANPTVWLLALALAMLATGTAGWGRGALSAWTVVPLHAAVT